MNTGLKSPAGENTDWDDISTRPDSNDLMWFSRGDTYDGPREPRFDDADYWDHWCYAKPPSLTALASPAGPWQTIETAPKDGSKVDLLYPYPRGRTIDCFWQEGGVHGDGGWYWLAPSWDENGLEPESEWSRNSYPNMYPTHWMPPTGTV